MSSESRIQQTFASLKSASQMAFMPFITAGDPSLEVTQRLIRRMAESGADLIEVGFPYSDPIADGPVIQASYTRALDGGLKIPQLIEAVAELPTDELPPIVAMVAYGIVFRMGLEDFSRQCAEAGFSGLIVPDLPGDEADELAEVARHAGLDLIELIAPTTPADRVDKIISTCSGFLYCISVAGTTGERQSLPEQLTTQLRDLRERTDLPLAVGFGISSPDQVDVLREVADGVIVGSAIVRHLESVSSGESNVDLMLDQVGQFVSAMIAETKKTAE